MFIPSTSDVAAKNTCRRTTRNFLRENRQMVGQRPKRESKARPGPAPYVAPRRRIPDGTQRITRFSEKQVQTEDISDKRFLSAAMLKCSEKGNFRPARSEGDEPELREGESWGKSLRLRRTASSCELGRMPEQRVGYQSGQYTLPRPPANGLDIVPRPCDESSTGSSSSGPSSPRVRQMNIPEMVDVDLDEATSLRSQASCVQLSLPEQAQKQELEEVKPEVKPQPEEKSQNQLPSESNIMPGELRIMLLEAARERQSQLLVEYNRLPISMGTLRVRNLKRQLEQELDVVDKDVSVLSQAKVYLRQDGKCATNRDLNCNRMRLFR